MKKGKRVVRKSAVVFISIALLISLSLSYFYYAAKQIEAAWYNDNWQNRVKLTINSAKVGGANESIDIGHETGNLTQYSNTVIDGGNLSVSSTAGLNGSGYGLSMLINDLTQLQAIKDQTKSTKLRYRFYFDPNTITMANNDHFVFSTLEQSGAPYNNATYTAVGYTTVGGYALYQYGNNDAGTQVMNDTVAISDAPHYIEIAAIQATNATSNDGSYEWWVDGVSQGAVTGIDNYNNMFDQNMSFYFRTQSLDVGTSGTVYIDDFVVNTDGSLIGPVLTDFPVFVDLSLLPSGFHSGVNQIDARDIRVTKADGVTELPREVVSYNAQTNTGELHVKYSGTLSSTTNTDIYIYYGNSAATDYTANATYGKNNVWDSGYKGVWHAAETSGQQTDSSTNANVTNAVSVTSQGGAVGKVGNTNEFNGSTDYVRVPTNASLTPSGDFTVESWVYLDTLPTVTGKNAIMVQKILDSSPWASYGLFVSSSSNAFNFAYMNTVAGYFDSYTYYAATVGTWYHVVGQLSSGKFQVYVNGSMSNTWNGTTFTGSHSSATGNLYMGSYDNTAGSGKVDGRTDEIRLSSVSRSMTWINTQYNNQSAPSAFFSVSQTDEQKRAAVLRLSFDEGTGTIAHDSSPNRTDGTLSGATLPAWQNKEMCISEKCLYYNGTTAYTSVATSIPNVQTVSFWVRPKTTTETLVDFDGGTHYISATSGTVSATGFSTPSIYVNGVLNGALVANNWQHVEVTTATSFTASNITIGKQSTSFLSGSIDEFRIYDYARSAAQVKTDSSGVSSVKGASVNFGSGPNSSLSQGLVGYWKMDEASGDVSDSSGNSATLTNTGTTTFVSGKFGKASNHVAASSQHLSSTAGTVSTYYFNGANGIVDVSDSWTNDTLAFDSSELTSSFNVSMGSSAQFNLNGKGTNAPASGGTITQVRARSLGDTVYFPSSASFIVEIGTSGRAEILATIANNSDGIPNWSSYGTLTTPSGGWTWNKIQNLEAMAYAPDYGDGNVLDTVEVYRVELEVTTSGGSSPSVKSVSFWANPTNTTNYYTSLTTGASITSTAGTLSATGFTNPHIYVNGVETSTIAANTWSHVTVTTDTAINADAFSIGKVSTNYYDGKIDEMRLYNRQLSLQEITQLYNWAPGPAGWWKMDENTGTTSVSDSSGNGNNGALSGISASDWGRGKYGASLNFDSVNNLVNVGSASSLDDLPASGATFSTWLYIRSNGEGGGNGRILEKMTLGDAQGYKLILTATPGKVQFVADFDGITDLLVNPTSLTIPLNSWHHLSVVWDGTGTAANVMFYIDGISAPTTVVSNGVGNRVSDAAQTMYIGNSSDGAHTFDGYIDEVKVYNYIRTPAQIVEDMNGGHPAPGSPVGSALIQYKFDEGYGTVANNSGSGESSYNGVITSGTWTNSGKFGKALTLTAASSITKTITDPAFSNALSIWVYPTTSIASKTLVTATKFVTDASSRPTYGSCVGTALTLSTWTHLVAVSDGAGSCKIFQNGIQTASGTTGVTFGPTINIGGTSFTGSVDEFKFFTFPLTIDQVKLLYNQSNGSVMGAISTESNGITAANSSNRSYCIPGDTSTCNPPIGEWKMDENTGTIAYDASGNGNTTASFGGNTNWKPGKFGSSLYVDGSGDYAQVTGLMSNPTNITISVWVNLSGVGSRGGDVISLGDCVAIRLDDPFSSRGSYGFYYVSGGTWNNTTTSLFKINTGWHHYVYVIDDTNNVQRFFIDGIKTAETVYSQSINYVGQGANTRIGSHANGGLTSDLKGNIDDLRIYNYARTPAQIAWDYNKGAPVAWWKMDENIGTTANDSSGNGLTGTLTGAVTWTTGKYNSGIATGTSAGVSIPDPANGKLDFGANDSFSLSAWVNTSTAVSKVIMFKNYDDINPAYRMRISSNSYAACDIHDGVTSLGIAGTVSVADGRWHHITCVRNASGTKSLSVYVDGVLADTNTDTLGSLANAGNLEISRIGSTGFPGSIDDVRVYNYPVTPQQIKNIMNEGAAIRFGP